MFARLQAPFVQVFQLLRQRGLAGRHLVRIDLLALFLQYIDREAVTRFTEGPEHLRLLRLQRTQPIRFLDRTLELFGIRDAGRFLKTMHIFTRVTACSFAFIDLLFEAGDGVDPSPV